MPKRPRSFDDTIQPMLKIHVQEKHVNSTNEERMKNVYDKTLNLLKEGVKALTHKVKVAETEPIDLLSPKVLSPCKAKSVRNLKQMILNNKLQLEISDTIIKDTQMDLCGCCRLINGSVLSKCYYCDQILCSTCLSECTKCSELFCANCSVSMYDWDEHSLCLNCYK